MDEWDKEWCIERHAEVSRRIMVVEKSHITLENKMDTFMKESILRQEEKLSHIYDKIEKGTDERKKLADTINTKFEQTSTLMQSRLPPWATIVIAILSSLVTGLGVSAFYK